MREQIIKVCKEYNYGEYTDSIIEAYDTLVKDEKAFNCFQKVLDEFRADAKITRDCETFMKYLKEYAVSAPIHEYSYNFLFYISLVPWLAEEYKKRGISDEIFHNTVRDLNAKLEECVDVYDVCGTCSPDWYYSMFKCRTFGLGRLQYVMGSYYGVDATIGGHDIKPGTMVVNCHIPSFKESFARDARVASYKEAYEFYKDKFDDGVVIFVCHSWLLFPEHKEMLPPTSNVVDFLNDFNIVSSGYYDNNNILWRIFGKAGRLYDSDVDVLPEDSSMKRAYKKHLAEGKRCGHGCGIFLYDGKNFIK